MRRGWGTRTELDEWAKLAAENDAAPTALAPSSPRRYSGGMEAFFIAAVAVLVAAVLLWRLRPVARWPRNMPYTRRAGLLSQGEFAFFRVLVRAVPRGVSVAPKVRLADLVTVAPDAWHTYGRPIAGKHVDFTLVDWDTTAILAVVELDDRTHEQRDRRERDDFVDGVLGSAKVPVFHVKAAARYNLEEVRRLVEGAIR